MILGSRLAFFALAAGKDFEKKVVNYIEEKMQRKSPELNRDFDPQAQSPQTKQKQSTKLIHNGNDLGCHTTILKDMPRN